MTTESRQDQWSVTMSVDGVGLGVADKCEGGGSTTDEVKRRPGGMGRQRALGGPSARDDLTVTYAQDLDGIHGQIPFLRSRNGKGVAQVNKQPLDRDGHIKGDAEAFTGVLVGVKTADVDSEGNDVGMVELVVSLNE